MKRVVAVLLILVVALRSSVGRPESIKPVITLPSGVRLDTANRDSIVGDGLIAQALGETAPLLMIGMVAFIVDVPGSVTDPGTVLPVQIFMWADFAERMFTAKTSAAIIILLGFLITMNAAAIWLRKKLERRW